MYTATYRTVMRSARASHRPVPGAPPSAAPVGRLDVMPEPSALDARLAEIDRRLRTIQSGLEPAAHPPAEPFLFPGPTLVPPPPPPATAPPGPATATATAPPGPATAPPAPGPASVTPAPALDPPPAHDSLPAHDPGDLIAALRDLVAGQERWLASARELLAAGDGAPAPVRVSAGPFAGTEALRRFERSLAALPEVRHVALREYAGEDRAIVDVDLFEPPIS